MDELLENFKNVETHCSYEEYENLVGTVNMCETALVTGKNLREVAEQVREINKRYETNVDLNPNNYLFTDEYKYIFNIRYILDTYWNTLRDHPSDYASQIRQSLNFYKEIISYLNK